jgi:phosphohistidine phosphatase SixA
MNTATMTEEIILHSAMVRTNLTLKEAVTAMEMYANDKEFQKQLDEVYQVEVFDDWDWHEGALDLK